MTVKYISKHTGCPEKNVPFILSSIFTKNLIKVYY